MECARTLAMPLLSLPYPHRPLIGIDMLYTQYIYIHCIYVYMCIHTHSMHIYIFTVYIYIYLLCIYIYICIYCMYIYIYIYIYICMYVCMYVCMYLCMYIYIYIYIYIGRGLRFPRAKRNLKSLSLIDISIRKGWGGGDVNVPWILRQQKMLLRWSSLWHAEGGWGGDVNVHGIVSPKDVVTLIFVVAYRGGWGGC